MPETGFAPWWRWRWPPRREEEREQPASSADPVATMAQPTDRLAKKIPAPSALKTVPPSIHIAEMSRSVRSSPPPPPCRIGARRDRERARHNAQRLDDPEDPAVAIAPTPTYRT